MSAPKHSAGSGEFAENSKSGRAPHDGGPGDAKKEAVLEDARDRVDGHTQLRVDRTEGGIENQVAVVRRKRPARRHPQLRPATQRLNRPAGRLPEEGQHLDRHRTAPQAANEFALVGDHDEAPAGVRNDLFAKQGAATSFETVDGGVDLIGAVYGQVE